METAQPLLAGGNGDRTTTRGARGTQKGPETFRPRGLRRVVEPPCAPRRGGALRRMPARRLPPPPLRCYPCGSTGASVVATGGAASPLAAGTASPAATIPLRAALHLADVPRRESPREHHRPRRVATPPHSPANAVGAVRRHRRGPRPAAGSVAPQRACGEGCAPGVVGDVAVRDPDAAEGGEGARRGLPSPRRSEARLLPAHGGDHRHVDALGASCAFDERGPALERGDLSGRERIEVGPQGGEGAGEGSGHGTGVPRMRRRYKRGACASRIAAAVGVVRSALQVTQRHHVASAQSIGGVCCVRVKGRWSVSQRQRGQRSMMAAGSGAVTASRSRRAVPSARPTCGRSSRGTRGVR